MTCDQFINAARRELTRLGRRRTRVINEYRAWGVTFDAALRLTTASRDGYVAVCSPPWPTAGYGIVIEPFRGTKSIIYATAGDLRKLPRATARLFAEPPPGGDFAVWYTPAARRKCSNQDMNRHEAMLLDDLS
jgi:hypothetical protein